MDNNSCHPMFSYFTMLTSLLMTRNLWTISKSEIGNSVWLLWLSHQVWLFSRSQIMAIRVLYSGNATKSTMNLVCIYYLAKFIRKLYSGYFECLIKMNRLNRPYYKAFTYDFSYFSKGNITTYLVIKNSMFPIRWWWKVSVWWF